MISGVYKIQNIENGMCYIGSTGNFGNRRRGHFSLLRRGVSKNRFLQKDYDKYGVKSFRFIEIARCDKDELRELEQLILDEHDFDSVYNICRDVSRPIDMPCHVRKRITEKISKPIIAHVYPTMEVVGEFNSALDCSRKLGICYSNIISVLNNKNNRKQTGGYCFKRIEKC